jgi:tetratricopeptide (TPR) repeat protein
MKTPMKAVLYSISFLLISCSSAPKRLPESTDTQASAEPLPLYEKEGLKIPVEAWVERAKQAYVAGSFPDATRFLETAFVYDAAAPDAAAADLLYYLYLAQGDYDRAVRLGRAIARKHPYRSQSYYQVGLAELWSGNDKVAAQSFQRALEFADHPPRTYFYLGLALEKSGDAAGQATAFQNAEKEYRQILRRNPENFSANYELAHLYLFWNVQWKKAESLMEAARKSLRKPDVETALRPKLYREHYLKLLDGIFWTHKGEPTRALPLLWETVQSAPGGARADMAEIYYYLGLNFAASKQDAQAKSFLTKAAQLDPNGPYSTKTDLILRKVASQPKKTGSSVAPAVGKPGQPR